MEKVPFYNLSEMEDPAYDLDIIDAIGRNIRSLRRARKLTQDELGPRAGISANYLGEIERGEKNATGLVIFKLARALDASILEIMPPRGNSFLLEVEKLFKDKDPKEVKRAIRMMGCFLDHAGEFEDEN